MKNNIKLKLTLLLKLCLKNIIASNSFQGFDAYILAFRLDSEEERFLILNKTYNIPITGVRTV